MDQQDREVVFTSLVSDDVDPLTAFVAANEPDPQPGTNWPAWAGILAAAAVLLWWVLRS